MPKYSKPVDKFPRNDVESVFLTEYTGFGKYFEKFEQQLPAMKDWRVNVKDFGRLAELLEQEMLRKCLKIGMKIAYPFTPTGYYCAD